MGLGLSLPPTPISARWLPAGKRLYVTFDQSLVDGVLDRTNWQYRYANRLYVPVVCGAVGNEVQMGAFSGMLNPGPNVVSYYPPPFDVTNLDLLPAPGFVDFPIP